MNPTSVNAIIYNSFGFGGHNATTAAKKFLG
jgi:3-oxoacyl-(acyl-carrier-protein) synthase